MKPILQALLLADKIYEDKSGKKIIAGTFNRLLVGSAPVIEQKTPQGQSEHVIQGGTDAGSPYLYVSLTDVIDGSEITLQFVNVSKNEPIFHSAMQVRSNDRLATIEIVIPLPPLGQFIQGVGDYSFDIVWKGEILGSHRLLVRDLSKPE